MKTPALIIALLLSTAATGAASAAVDAIATPGAQARREPAAAPEPRATQPTRLAEGFLEKLRGRDHHGERHADKDDDDDDDEDRGGRHGRNGGANRQADPNAANAPVPDNGVFNGKARPKVEVQ
jgi:hypothetical protein